MVHVDVIPPAPHQPQHPAPAQAGKANKQKKKSKKTKRVSSPFAYTGTFGENTFFVTNLSFRHTFLFLRTPSVIRPSYIYQEIWPETCIISDALKLRMYILTNFTRSFQPTPAQNRRVTRYYAALESRFSDHEVSRSHVREGLRARKVCDYSLFYK